MRLLRPEHRVLTIAGFAASLAILALCLLLLVRVNTNTKFQKQTADNCMAIEALKSTIRATFIASEARAIARRDLDPAQRNEIRRAYAEEFARYAPSDCPDQP